MPPAARATSQADEVGYIQWSAVFAGALAAAALALVLHSFAASIGLSLASTAPTWRDASMALILVTGLYLLLVAFASYGLGGYVAGRARSTFVGGSDEIEFRDGTHGVLVWAIATLLTALFAFGIASAASRLAAPSAGSAGPAATVAGENLLAYDLDRLFRSDRRPEGDVSLARAEAGRILLTASGHRGVSAEDRTHLVRMVSARTGLAQPEAEARVATVIASSRDNVARARRSSIILGFMAGAAALLGAAAAWFGSVAGGRHRDGKSAPSATWGFPPEWARRRS